MEPDKETLNYLTLKEGGKLTPRARLTDTGELKAKKRAKRAAKRTKNTTKSIVGAHNLFFNPQEKDIYNEVYRKTSEIIKERKSEITYIDELLLTGLCVAQVRQFRKTRLESSFNRFMDRQCPQDPHSQTIASLKALGLTNDKEKGINTGKEILGKLLSQESENLDAKAESDLTYEEWKSAQASQEIKIERFTPNTMANYDVDIIDVRSEEEINNSNSIKIIQ